MRRRTALLTVTSLALALSGAAAPAAGTVDDDARRGSWEGTAHDPTAGALPSDRGVFGAAPAGAAGVRPAEVEGESADGLSPLALVPPEQAADRPAPPVHAPVAGRVLVRLAPGAAPGERAAVLEAASGTLVGEVPGTDMVVVDIGDQDPATVAATLTETDGVEVAQPDHVRSASIWPDDPAVSVTWPYLDLVRLPRAWDETIGAGTVVAVLDTGVYADHEDLQGGVLPGWDFVNDDDDASDDEGHGTLVAGTLAATGDNGRGGVGAAPGALILPVKVLDAAGNGSDSVVAAGIAFAVESGADVINLSLGGAEASPVLLDAIEQAVTAGAVVVAAAGNDLLGGPQYPAAYAPDVEGLLSVSATDDEGRLARFSSWDDSVSLAAPGTDIVGPSVAGPDRYAAASGTSFAAPFVSGAAALVRAQTPGLSPGQVEERLLAAARDAGPRGVDPYYGRGVLDTAAATGAVRAVPLDRGPSDGGADDVPAGAATLAVGSDGLATAVGTAESEGDVDWYRYDAPRPGRYLISVSPEWGAGILLNVRDSAGDVVAHEGWSGAGSASRAVVDGAGPWWIGVQGSGAEPDFNRYALRVEWATQPHEAPVTYGPDELLDASRGGAGRSLVDVTGDGLPDLVGATSWPAPRPDGTVGLAPAVGFYPAMSPTGFGPFRGVRLDDEMGLSPAVTAADLDGDGIAEIVAHADQDAHPGVWTIDATEPVLTPVRVHTGALPSHWLRWEGVDLDRDGDDEVLMPTSSGIRVLDAGPAGIDVAEWAGWAPGDPPHLALDDLDADGDLDVAAAGRGTLLQQSDGSFAVGPAVPALAGATRVAAGDVTGDGRTDLVVAAGTEVRLAAGRTDGGFGDPVSLGQVSDAADQISLVDVDGDGRLDVSTVALGWVTVILQRGDGTFMVPQIARVRDAMGTVFLTDRDGDRDVDLLWSTSLFGVFVQYQTEPAVVDPPPGWVWDSSVRPHTSGAEVRPNVRLTLRNTLVPSSADARTVRLVDGSTGDDVPLVLGYASDTGELTATPSADLVPGRHYELLVVGLVDTTGAVMSVPYRTWFTVAADGDRFTPVDPYRVLDTRWGDAPVPAGEPLVLDLAGAVPVGATAVVLNVAVTQAAAVGNVRVYPASSEEVPRVANLNVVPGVDQSNLVTVSLDRGTRVALLAEGTSTHLVADLAGYYSPRGATAFVPLAPFRVLDQRDGTGGVRPGPLAAGTYVDVQVAGRNGVPADAAAVVFNLAATGVAGGTHVRVYPTPAASEDQDPPDIANLNVRSGRDQANLVTVRLGDGGKVRLYTHSASLFLVADLAGYYSPSGDHGFVPITPQRIADSRIGQGLPAGHLRAGTTTDLMVAGEAGVPEDAVSVALNVAATQVRGQTHVRAFPTTVPATLPDVSTLNLVPGRDESNHAFVRLGDGGRVSFYPHSADVQLVVDAFGYFRR